ncbi:transporter substrate-binding domain-containing protein [Telmatospirillum sp. J64-1]|uniref:transporter substrate-binding domain-containing protein n=1 Tax=Telmatospirillum sp. J64-1 TaxID=2502183 RepID=UPI00163DAC25|nr:transporter substrate-binding domain-containing protein [Telmatospirillum sp. J64-1]
MRQFRSILGAMTLAAGALLTVVPTAHAEGLLEKVRQKGVMTAGSSAAYPPFEFVQDGKLVGFDIDMAEELGRRMGVKIEFEKIDFKGIVAALQSGRVDSLITALTWTPERAERIAFSIPYFDAGIGALIPTDSDIADPQDLTGKRVGVQLGSSGERYVREMLQDSVAQILTYDAITLAVNDMRNGRVDAVVNPLPVLRYASRGDNFTTTGIWDSRVVGINTRLEDEDLMAEINKHLEDMKADGFLAELEEKWFGNNAS